MGIELPWKGKGKDTKLLDILNAFIPLINSVMITLCRMMKFL